MSKRTQAVDHLQDPSTTLRPIRMFGLFRGLRVQYFPNTKRGREFSPSRPSCRVNPIIGNEPQTRQVWHPNSNRAKACGITVPSPNFFGTVRAMHHSGRSYSLWDHPRPRPSKLHTMRRLVPNSKRGQLVRKIEGPPQNQCYRPRNCATAGSSRTRFRRGLRVSSPTIARPCAVNARPSGLPSRSPSRHASRSAAVPPPAGRSSSRAIVQDLSLSR